MFGELIPMGGGDTVPLVKRSLLVGRRESCDIVLRFSNVSAHHCQFSVNGVRIGTSEKLLEPGDEVSVAKHNYTIQYAPYDIGAVGPPPSENREETPASIFGKSLLERAGLTKADIGGRDTGPRRFDVLNNEAGQIKNPYVPV